MAVILTACDGAKGPGGSDSDTTGSDTTHSDTTDSDSDGTPDADDCAPNDPAVHPGADELCNDVDDDCDGSTDEDASGYPDSDGDGDGYGDETARAVRSGCAGPRAAACG